MDHQVSRALTTLGCFRFQRSETHDSLRYINIFTYLDQLAKDCFVCVYLITFTYHTYIGICLFIHKTIVLYGSAVDFM